ncbi:hypothetical protein [Nocardia noduli]|uniref:hypothetical protein n=1 Tax=Nocardia noduli TaxID=2815722 RepID=UPI001C229CC4|nr:hypothetical protein [Nocardia noduli]
MADGVEATVDPEGHLLGYGTAVDIAGQAYETFPTEFRLGVLERHPRIGIADEFLTCFQAQAGRKPHGGPAEALRNGVAALITANPLDRA